MAEYTHSDDERAFWARLSDEHIRDEYATIENQGGEYVSPIRRAAFESWLAAHDARVRREAERSALDGLAAELMEAARDCATDGDHGGAGAWRNASAHTHHLRDTHYPEETP